MKILVKALIFPQKIKSIGYLHSMDDYEKRKLGVFNVLNAIGFIIGVMLPFIGIFIAHIHLPAFAWLVTFLPAMINLVVLILNSYKLHQQAYLSYFIFYPVLTALVYLVSFDVGIELFFLLYGVLSVFFLHKFIHAMIGFALSIACYFVVFVFVRDYHISMVHINFPFYVLNHIIPAAFIFYALFLVKNENTQYQLSILEKNQALQQFNLEVQKQKEEIHEKHLLLQKKNQIIDEKARQLQKQTEELTELNSVKNKLFSVISHDLKAPLYALRNLFRGVQKYDVPAEDVKRFVPDVVKDLNYTTALMENLLTWVKSQMQIQIMKPQMLEVSELVREAADLLRLPASTKRIHMNILIPAPVFIFADRDMISLVVRNLLSNAIKFTPEDGQVTIGVEEKSAAVDIYVKDTGVGMTPDVLNKLSENNFFTTRGTANESGTGLGLMLCKDFLSRNGSFLKMQSEYGKGSTFSFILPRKSA